jgi:hypothetical protein
LDGVWRRFDGKTIGIPDIRHPALALTCTCTLPSITSPTASPLGHGRPKVTETGLSTCLCSSNQRIILEVLHASSMTRPVAAHEPAMFLSFWNGEMRFSEVIYRCSKAIRGYFHALEAILVTHNSIARPGRRLRACKKSPQSASLMFLLEANENALKQGRWDISTTFRLLFKGCSSRGEIDHNVSICDSGQG